MVQAEKIHLKEKFGPPKQKHTGRVYDKNLFDSPNKRYTDEEGKMDEKIREIEVYVAYTKAIHESAINFIEHTKEIKMFETLLASIKELEEGIKKHQRYGEHWSIDEELYKLIEKEKP